jgi:hypothetical protein
MFVPIHLLKLAPGNLYSLFRACLAALHVPGGAGVGAGEAVIFTLLSTLANGRAQMVARIFPRAEVSITNFYFCQVDLTNCQTSAKKKQETLTVGINWAGLCHHPSEMQYDPAHPYR